jgi:MFS family permease
MICDQMERACDQHPRRVTAARIAKGLAAAMTARCGILLFLRIDSASGYLAVLLPALVIHGIGNGLSFPSLNIAAVSDLPEHQQGLASGLITSAVQIGAGIGVAVLAPFLVVPGLTGYRLVFLAAGYFSVIGALVAALGIRATKPTRQPVPTHP